MSGKNVALTDTAEMVELFTIVALKNGSMSAAVNEVNERREAEGKKPIALRTMQEYRQRNRELYEKVRKDVVESVRQSAAERHMEAADVAMEVEYELTQRLKRHVEDIDPRDLPGAIRNAATSAGIHRDKALALTGDAQGGVNISLNMGELLRNLAAKGTPLYNAEGKRVSVEQAIEGEAKELTSADE